MLSFLPVIEDINRNELINKNIYHRKMCRIFNVLVFLLYLLVVTISPGLNNMILLLIELCMLGMEYINLLLVEFHKFCLLFKKWICCKAFSNSFHKCSLIVFHVPDTMVAWGADIIKKRSLLFFFFVFPSRVEAEGNGINSLEKKGLLWQTWNSRVRSKDRWSWVWRWSRV